MSKFQSRQTYHLLLLLLLGTKINLPVVQERMLWLICERNSIRPPCSTYLFVSYKLSKFQSRQTNHLLLLFLLGTKINLPPVVREGMDALVDLLKKFKMTTLQHLPVWQYGLWSFLTGGTKLEIFLPKNQHTQRKFEF